MKWIQPPKLTCFLTHMFDDVDYWKKINAKDFNKSIFVNSGYKTNLSENEIVFDAADLIRMGKDIFYKKSVSANNQGFKWLRRTFLHLRFHMMHFATDASYHLDFSLIPLRPPTSGSPGLVLLNTNDPPLASEMKLFLDNDWRLVWAPMYSSSKAPLLALCSANLHTNILSLNDHCVIIEECETALYHLLHDELGFDVITRPLRILTNSVEAFIVVGVYYYCFFVTLIFDMVTWDIRRDDSCIDYFPNQDYTAECQLDLDNYFDRTIFSNDKKTDNPGKKVLI